MKKLQPHEEIPPEVMNKFAELLNSLLQGRGFILITYQFNQPNALAQYVSNTGRSEAQNALELFLKKWKSQS